MCGIVGVFEFGHTSGRVTEELVVRMRETIRHRGPDGEGIFVSPDQRLGLGHRRLSIIDLEHGAQPMFGQGGTCLVFNGEIYNYPALRDRLIADGVKFRTDCDTEVILHLYERYGEDCVRHLTGMFAFAIWDPRRDEVLLARDPIGEKPLYWAQRHGTLVFASEIKALLEHPAIDREVNTDALGPYLANLVTPGPDTLYAGIEKLPAGCRARCDRTGVRVERYWSLTQPRRFVDAEEHDATRRVRELLDASVHSRLMSDVPVGVLLSGGMDSSTIVALLKEQARDVASFTVGFPGYGGHDERAEARWVADRFGTDHHEVVLTEDDALGSLRALVHHGDEPLADPVCVPLYAVTKLARDNGIKVVLAGEGADELFWGYDGYRQVLERWRRYAAMLALPRAARRLASRVTSPSRRPRRREQLEGVAAGRPNPVHMPVGLTAYQRRRLLLSAVDGAGWAPAESRDGEDALTTLGFDTQEYEFQVRLPELLLMRIDRFSMANSVEARVPFLDPALVEYVYRLPLGLKVRDGISKRILKEAVADVVPERVSKRPKQGFSAPTSEWFAAAHGGLLRDLMRQDALRAYFDIDYLERMLDTGDPTTWESGQILWPILNFGLWHKYWIEGEPFEDLVSAASNATA
jgi:asparagine synthase (glutamine-hydrolysing)